MTTKPYWRDGIKHMLVYQLGIAGQVMHWAKTGHWRDYEITECDGFACRNCRDIEERDMMIWPEHARAIPAKYQAKAKRAEDSWADRLRQLGAKVSNWKAEHEGGEIKPIRIVNVYNVQGPTIDGSEVKTALERDFDCCTQSKGLLDEQSQRDQGADKRADLERYLRHGGKED